MSVLYKRVLNYSLTSILRNKLLSLGTILVISVVVFFLNILEGAFFISNTTINQLNDKIDFNVELTETVDVDNVLVQDLANEFEQMGIEVELVSKQQALETFEAIRPEFSSFRTKHNLDNPLPASLYLSSVGSSLFDDVKDVLAVSKYQEVLNRDINSSLVSIQEEKVEKWREIIRFVEIALHGMRLAFYLVAVLIIISTIRIIILSREKEIDIMELVGAPYDMMRLPFIIEGVLYSLVGVFVGLFFYNFFLSGLYSQMAQGQIDPFLLLLLEGVHGHFTANTVSLFLGQGFVFLLIGGIGSLAAITHFFVTKGIHRRRVNF